MKKLEVSPVGLVENNENGMLIKLEPEYISGLKALEGFSHINVIWWFSDFDSMEFREGVEMPQPYKKAPEVMGVFATRSPIRPNPIAVSTVEVLQVNYEQGIIRVAYIDANDQTPVLDLKPYTPSMDRIEKPSVPSWCSHWPESVEASGQFPWENEFNF